MRVESTYEEGYSREKYKEGKEGGSPHMRSEGGRERGSEGVGPHMRDTAQCSTVPYRGRAELWRVQTGAILTKTQKQKQEQEQESNGCACQLQNTRTIGE